jgi:hypothetical protein
MIAERLRPADIRQILSQDVDMGPDCVRNHFTRRRQPQDGDSRTARLLTAPAEERAHFVPVFVSERCGIQTEQNVVQTHRDGLTRGSA